MLRKVGLMFQPLRLAIIGIVCALMPQANASFDSLPADLQITIWSKTTVNGEEGEVPVLSIKDLGNCARVSKLWNEITSDDRVWKLHFQRTYGLEHIPVDFYHDFSPRFLGLLQGDAPYKKKQLVLQIGHVKDDLSKNPLKEHRTCALQNIIGLLGDSGEGSAGALLGSQHHRFIHLMLALEHLGDKSLIDTYLSDKNVKAQLGNAIEDFRSVLHLLIKRGSKVARIYEEKLPTKSL